MTLYGVFIKGDKGYVKDATSRTMPQISLEELVKVLQNNTEVQIDVFTPEGKQTYILSRKSVYGHRNGQQP